MTEEQIKAISQQVAANMGQTLSLAKADALIRQVMAKAEEMGVRAVVAVADCHANPIAVKSMDNAFIASWDIAFNKAYTVAALKMPTSKLSTLAAPGGSLYGIQHTNQGRIVIFGGGEPLYDTAGNLVGGLGVSGGTEGQDTSLAEYGAQIFKQL